MPGILLWSTDAPISGVVPEYLYVPIAENVSEPFHRPTVTTKKREYWLVRRGETLTDIDVTLLSLIDTRFMTLLYC